MFFCTVLCWNFVGFFREVLSLEGKFSPNRSVYVRGSYCCWFRNPGKYWADMYFQPCKELIKNICHINWWVYRISEASTGFLVLCVLELSSDKNMFQNLRASEVLIGTLPHVIFCGHLKKRNPKTESNTLGNMTGCLGIIYLFAADTFTTSFRAKHVYQDMIPNTWCIRRLHNYIFLRIHR